MLESKWGLRFIAFILALLLFLSVNNLDIFGGIFNNSGMKNSSRVIENVPVETIYDSKKLYLAGAPKTVDVKVNGPQSTIFQAEKLLDFRVLLDLKGQSTGEYNKKFKVKGLSKELNYQVIPNSATVTLQEKVSKKYPVEAEINNNRIASGYESTDEEINPSQVTITGGRKEMDKIAYVKATLDETKQLTSDTTERAVITVLDSNLNKLDVQVRPENVDVKIKVAQSSKTVSLNPVITGVSENEIGIQSVELNHEEMKIYGPRNILDNINSIDVPIDASDIDEDTKKKVKIKLPENIDKSEYKNVEAKIKTVKN